MKNLGLCVALALSGTAVLSLSGCGTPESESDCPIIINSIAPKSGRVGDMVTIIGEHLGGSRSIVGFSGVVADPLAGATETMVSVKVPNGAQTAPITVDDPTSQNCQSSSADTFVVMP